MYRITAGAMALTACSPFGTEEVSDVIAHTRHCGGVTVSERLLIRVSRYEPPTPADDLIIVAACIPEGGCSPLLTYEDGLPPLIEAGEAGVTLRFVANDYSAHGNEVSLRQGVNLPVTFEAVSPGDR